MDEPIIRPNLKPFIEKIASQYNSTITEIIEEAVTEYYHDEFMDYVSKNRNSK